MNRQDHGREALLFAHYYLGTPAPDAVNKRYAAYLALYPGKISVSDEKLLHFALQRPWSIRLLDAGLALTSPQAELRRRLYVMFALLEADTTYTQLFLSQERTKWYVFHIIKISINAAMKTLAGIILVKVIAK